MIHERDLPNLTGGQVGVMDAIATEVREVEKVLADQMGSRVELVEAVSRHTLDAGGKRMRPAFVILAARATGLPFDIERARRLGAAMEMVHMATLIHDDVVDRSPTRRGRETAHHLFGATGSVLSGDVLLSKAMHILAQDGDLDIIRCVAHSVVEMAEGEVREVETRNEFDLTQEDHIEILRMKTAAFIECCCEVGGYLAKASAPAQSALQKYGLHVGLAFQIADDLLDYRGDQSKTGKAVATDFREGCATLPLIYLRESLTEEENVVARAKFGNGVSDDEIAMIVSWMESRGAFKRAEESAYDHLNRALDALDVLPTSHERELLETVGRFVVRRDL